MSALALDTDYHDFDFREDTHTYTTSDGVVRKSITQALSAAGIYDFSMIPVAILENARRRGVNVHRFCAELDIHNFLDPLWPREDEAPYIEAWMKFKRESKIKIVKVETPIVRTVGQFVIAGTPDVVGFFGRNKFVVERKACRAKHPGWALQTGMQEMLETGRFRLGYCGRMSVQLLPTGNYSTSIYEDPADLAAIHATLILANKTDRFEREDARLTLEAWAYNKGLRLAA